jgi:tight adherence protein B
MLLILILVLLSASIILIGMQVMPLILERLRQEQEKKVTQAESQLSQMFIQVKQERLILFYTLAPLVAGLAALALTKNFLLGILAAVVGFALPTLVIKVIERRRKNRFRGQLVDGLLMLSSSLKAGLSLIQALEVITEEMPAPMSQEFGLLLRENKMGITLDESLKKLNSKMQIEELSLVINAILVARETGGDLTKVFSRLATTLRDNMKLKENINTLTMQGRLQGIIMSLLPFVFVGWVVAFNPHHFDVMFNSDLGRMLLIIAVVLQVVGIFLIRKFSIIRI